MSVADVLPSNMTGFERSVAEAMTDTLPVPLREIMSPADTPLAFLPFLAAHESVDLWFADWSDARKRAMVEEATTLARKKGTRAGAIRFLSYVDGTLVDAISYPAKFVVGRGRVGRTPVGHPPFVARYLVKVVILKRPRHFVMGRSFVGSGRLHTADRTKILRAMAALRAAKAPETELRADFAHFRQPTLDDGIALDPGYALGAYAPRSKL
jgi:P2-related tail formation protein